MTATGLDRTCARDLAAFGGMALLEDGGGRSLEGKAGRVGDFCGPLF